MTLLRFCLACDTHHPLGHACARREAQRYAASKERRTRGTAKWKKARTLARQRDAERCTVCGSSDRLEVHHRIPISEGGDRFALSNLVTLCSSCHHDSHRGRGSTRVQSPIHPVPVSRETNRGERDDPLLG